MLLGGRGSGKTKAGAEWVNGIAHGFRPFADKPVSPIALIGETFSDVREVMIDGPAGIMNCITLEKPKFEAMRRRLVWPNGAVAMMFSAQEPESLRGPQFAAAWCDELAKWQLDRETWDMLQFGLRLGETPRQLVTTTPRPTKLVKEIFAATDTIVTRMKTENNAKNLAPGFIRAMNEKYGGTRLGRQELDGEIVEDVRGALWNRLQLDGLLGEAPLAFTRIVVGVDPSVTAKAKSDRCGIVVVGLADNGKAWVLADKTIPAATPNGWSKAAAAAFHAHEADCIVVEVNQGGDMVKEIMHTADPTIAVREVRATRSKRVRAEPIATLYENDRVRHVRGLGDLEDEMCSFGLNGLSSGRSPDRLDALVWALWSLLLDKAHQPRVRAL